MLINIVFKSIADDVALKATKFPPEDGKWFHGKCKAAMSGKKPHQLKLNLEEAVRLLRAFNDVEEITFTVI